jgi:hypothetical protein
MVRHQLIPLDSPDEWRDALRGIPHAFAQTWEHCYAMHLTNGLKTYLYCFERDAVRIVCPFALREFDGYVDIVKPYGFSGFVGNGDCPAFSHYWKEFARQQGYVCGYLGVNPIFEQSAYFAPDEVYSYNTVFVLDLTLSDRELFANLSENRKRQLRNWDQIASSLVLDRSAGADFFVSHYLDFVREKNAPSAYHFSEETLSFLTNLPNVLIVGARKDEKLVAVSVFGYTPDAGDFLFNVSVQEGRNYSAVLIWYGVQHLKALDVPLLNLGGGGHEDDSLADFKARFGSQKLPLRCAKQVYQREIYDQLCQRMNVDPNDMTGYFPAYRAPR